MVPLAALSQSGCSSEPSLDSRAVEQAIDPVPELVDDNLTVTAVVSGLAQPTTMAFLGEDDFLVLEKASGAVKRVVNGAVQGTVLDLAVNSASERGLLGIALHPDFPTDAGVYLYWTESTTGADSSVLSETPLLGNRVDRFVWNGSSLTLDHNVVKVRAIQQDATNGVARGNHDGGPIEFGPDGKLYVFVGDVGRRGQLQNLSNGPFGAGTPDDQYGGPEPDDAHLTGVVLRLNADGTTPTDNPFYALGASLGGQVGANLGKIFSYGHRNSFGMAFDPQSGSLWLQENGDDSFTELNLVTAGMNGGWVQIMGPVSRVGQYRSIETSSTYFGVQQVRWSPVNIAATPADALSSLYMLQGAKYVDPKFSWKYEVAPAGIGFVKGRALGSAYEGDLIIGAARPTLLDGYLFRFNLTGNRRNVAVADRRLRDRVADNTDKHDLTESESLVFGRGFGVSTDIETGPNGDLFVVSLSHGKVYEISRAK